MDKIIIRRWRRSPRTVIALFPDIPASPGLVQSYEHIGQHGGADLDYILQPNTTQPASRRAPDTKELLNELKTLGYELEE